MIGAPTAAADEGQPQPSLAAILKGEAGPVDSLYVVQLLEASVDRFASENDLPTFPWVNIPHEGFSEMPAGCADNMYGYSSNTYLFCSTDAHAYIGIDMADRFDTHHYLAAGFTIAHEWGHGLQLRRGAWGMPRTEDGSDCVGGAWMAWLNVREGMNIGLGDLPGLWSLMDAIGKKGDVPAEDPHGTPIERSGATSIGFFGGLRACNTIVPTTP